MANYRLEFADSITDQKTCYEFWDEDEPGTKLTVIRRHSGTTMIELPKGTSLATLQSLMPALLERMQQQGWIEDSQD